MIKRFVSWFVLIPISLLLIFFALANRHLVKLNFDPLTPENPFLPSVNIPLFIIIFAILLLGIILGGVAVWFSQAKNRKALRKTRNEVNYLKLELSQLKQQSEKNIKDKNLLAPDDFI